MLNDREIIEHWRLRAEYELAVGICAAAAFMALLFAALALGGVAPWQLWAICAGWDAAGAAVLAWRIRRVRARLEQLEAYIP